MKFSTILILFFFSVYSFIFYHYSNSKKEIEKLAGSPLSQDSIFRETPEVKANFTKLNDLKVNKSLIEPFEVSKNIETEFCQDLDAPEKEQDLMKLSSYEHELLNGEELSNTQIEILRAKIYAIRDAYEMPLDDFNVPLEDLMAIKITDANPDDYFFLPSSKRQELIYELGGTQYLKRAYINEEYLGIFRTTASSQELNALQREKQNNLIWKQELIPVDSNNLPRIENEKTL